ncbi:Single-stranded DNA-binding protein [Pseudomonas caricapapayae]|uniref:Single-stranded DNA-binding protein n=1 Tax=Pseudomonas caricapapayae TaxID=46678 RepID=A0A3M6EYW2_9PSED|nr:single-stranded DNA-binding protein [Pseudomonas caricapapayae]RMV73327.1 Single-stranded DNA-binding protein [Pseudomonas caricapapayae]
MSTTWSGEGNIGQDPEFKVVKTSNGERTLLECSVYFDNQVPVGDQFEDRGGFWATVEWWHQSAEAFSKVFKKGMRVLVPGTLIMDTFQSNSGEDRARMKVRAERIALLPYRIENVTMASPRVRENPAH